MTTTATAHPEEQEADKNTNRRRNVTAEEESSWSIPKNLPVKTSAAQRFLDIWQASLSTNSTNATSKTSSDGKGVVTAAAARVQIQAILRETPLAGRIIHGRSDMPGFGKLLSADEWKRLSWVFGPEALSDFVGRSPREMCLKLGFGEHWLDRKLETGIQFILAVFPQDSVDTHLATWDNVESVLLEKYYPTVWTTHVKPHMQTIRNTSYAEMCKRGNYDMDAVNMIGRYDAVTGESHDSRYMSLQRLERLDAEDKHAVTPVKVRQFLYDELGFKKLFQGTGYTVNDEGDIGYPEYLAQNRSLDDIEGIATLQVVPK